MENEGVFYKEDGRDTVPHRVCEVPERSANHRSVVSETSGS